MVPADCTAAFMSINISVCISEKEGLKKIPFSYLEKINSNFFNIITYLVNVHISGCPVSVIIYFFYSIIMQIRIQIKVYIIDWLGSVFYLLNLCSLMFLFLPLGKIQTR